MQVLKSSAPELMKLAKARASRSDVGGTATWQYSGPGRTVILVHGFRGDHHGLSAIAGALPGHHVVIPDLPGYGKTPAFEGEHNLESYGSWFAEFVQGFDNPIVLGHSFGSLVVAKSWEIGMRQPTILLNPISTIQNQEPTGRISDLYYKLGSLGSFGSMLLRSTLVVRVMSMLMATTWDLKLRSFIHNQHHSFFSNYSLDRVVLEGYRAASSYSVLQFVKSAPEKLLLIAGSKDLIAPLKGQLELQRQSSAELRMLQCGHLTHYETPYEVGQMVEDFVREIN